MGKSLLCCLLTCNWCVVRVITVMCNRPLHCSGVSAAEFLATNCKQLQHFHLPPMPRPPQPASRHNNTNNITGQHTSPVINCLLFYATVSNYLPTIYCTRVRDIWSLWGWVNYLSQTIYSREFVFNRFFTSFALICHISSCFLYLLAISTLHIIHYYIPSWSNVPCMIGGLFRAGRVCR